MTEYMNMWRNFANFSDRTNPRGFWMAFLFNILAEIILYVVYIILDVNIFGSLYSIAYVIPGLAITVRRLRDAGKNWYNIFFYLIPLIGWIIMIVFLLKPSVPDDDIPVV